MFGVVSCRCFDVATANPPSRKPLTTRALPPPPPARLSRPLHPLVFTRSIERLLSTTEDDDIPGKIVLSPEVLAEQQKGLEKIAQQLRRERLDKEAEDAITFGFCPRAELWNGRCVCARACARCW